MSEELKEHLVELGLQHYVSALLNAGYDTWDSIADITESDFEALNIRLGDRRKLQREIARRQFWPENYPLPSSDELREFTISLQDKVAEPFKNGYFQHHVSEAMETEANSPQIPGSLAKGASALKDKNEGPASVAEISESSDTTPSLEPDPAITDEDKAFRESVPYHLSAIMDTESDDDPTPLAVESRAPLVE